MPGAVSKTGEAAAKVVASTSKSEVPPKLPPRAPKQRAHGKEEKKVPKLRPRLVRDSFTMPEADFAVIATLKATALGARRAAKKSELLRAGLRALVELDAKALVAALDRLVAVKTGRPKKGR